MKITTVHLTASRFYGGPERQMIELACELFPDVTSSFLSFSENGLCEEFLKQVRCAGLKAVRLTNDTPHLIAAGKELHQRLVEMQATVLCVHGYKACLLGLLVGRRLRLPVIAVSRGWTAENWKVRLYERLDRMALRRMDRVVCVSQGQAAKVGRAGVPHDKLVVIHNAIRTERFQEAPHPEFRRRLADLFDGSPPLIIIGAAGRLSPEKGFDVLINAAELLQRNGGIDFGIVLFGDGPLRDSLQRQIDAASLRARFILAGFTSELDQYMPHFDLFVQSSHTEGLPNVLLEAAAAGVPVVATDVGGTREVVVDGKTGRIVPPDSPQALADGIVELSANAEKLEAIGQEASRHVALQFTFAAQAEAYKGLFATVL